MPLPHQRQKKGLPPTKGRGSCAGLPGLQEAGGVLVSRSLQNQALSPHALMAKPAVAQMAVGLILFSALSGVSSSLTLRAQVAHLGSLSRVPVTASSRNPTRRKITRVLWSGGGRTLPPAGGVPGSPAAAWPQHLLITPRPVSPSPSSDN